MSLAARIVALLTSLTPGQVVAMSPAERQLLSDQCRRVLQLAESTCAGENAPKGGFFAELRDGRGNQ